MCIDMHVLMHMFTHIVIYIGSGSYTHVCTYAYGYVHSQFYMVLVLNPKS